MNTTGKQNTAFGGNALLSNLTGKFNTAIGYNALTSQNTSADISTNNTAVGTNALVKLTSGSCNTALGTNSGSRITTGERNTTIGEGTMGILNGNFAVPADTASTDNTLVGYRAGLGVTTGGFNTAMGALSLSGQNSGPDLFLTTGTYNTVVGYAAGSRISSGSNNIAVGAYAFGKLQYNYSGINNVAVGYQAIGNNWGGNYNVAVGHMAFSGTADGTYSGITAIGGNTLMGATSGLYPTTVGYESLKSLTTGNYNTAVGCQAATTLTTGGNNVAFGKSAMLSNTTTSDNVAIGFNAIKTNTASGQLTAVGSGAMEFAMGQQNTALGYQAGRGASGTNVGNYNTALGWGTLSVNTSGGYNTAIGNQALVTNTGGTFNVGIGHGALFVNTTGSNNTAIGVSALQQTSLGTNNDNTAIGYFAGQYNTGSNNTILGSSAAVSGTSIYTGSNNIVIGYQANPSAIGADSETTIGTTTVGMIRVTAANASISSTNIALNNTTVTGTLNVTGGATLFGISNLGYTNSNLYVEIGSSSTFDAAIIDFHSNDGGATATDYDTRIISYGGTAGTDGKGRLEIEGLSTTIKSTADSTGTINGALQVLGGAGIGKNVYIGGALTVAGTITSLLSSASSLLATTITGGLVVTGGSLNVSGASRLAVTTITGGLVVNGGSLLVDTFGAKVTGRLYISGIATVNGDATTTAGVNALSLQNGGGMGLGFSSGVVKYLTEGSHIFYTGSTYNTNGTERFQINTSGVTIVGTANATTFNATSDKRIKANIIDISGSSLDLLRKINPKEYTIIGNKKPRYGFIAQEVKQHIPRSVELTTDYIPSIYENAFVKGNTITLINKSTTDISNCKLKLRDISNGEIIVNVAHIQDDKTIYISEDISKERLTCMDICGNNLDKHINNGKVVYKKGPQIYTGEVKQGLFVYGIEVNDFHSINHDTIWTIAVGATKEMDVQLQEARQTIKSLEERISAIESLEERMSAIERLLLR
jgi:hypothetical protein